MIVSLDELKRVLGLSLEAEDEDENLTRLILEKTEWVQQTTHRRFDAPLLTTEYRIGNGLRSLYLAGHVDDSVAADNPSETDPTTSVQVHRRGINDPGEWEALVEGTDWERRADELVFLTPWAVWPCTDEVRLIYLDGYAEAPEDIKALVLELAKNQYLLDVDSGSGLSGITSEKLGDFSYSSDGTSGGTTEISATGLRTLNNRTRKFV